MNCVDISIQQFIALITIAVLTLMLLCGIIACFKTFVCIALEMKEERYDPDVIFLKSDAVKGDYGRAKG